MLRKRSFNSVFFTVLIVAFLSGCVATQPVEDNSQVELNNDDLYEVHHDGRIYIFDDFALYEDFVKMGHTPYILARIGAGPKGKTIKFGLASKDKKKQSGIASVDLYDGKLLPADSFYGETRMDGRIYVFSTLADMNAVRAVGEAAYRFADIGSGPSGETVVYVLNKSNKKKKPTALMQAFKARHSQS